VASFAPWESIGNQREGFGREQDVNGKRFLTNTTNASAAPPPLMMVTNWNAAAKK
jgi:hypothetical protein